ncbi:hypothetical protein POTOM_057549 [Populus tomentosa]|uniref:Ubiquitin-like domain-containing protein n=1 Tax=Populus tomentosa TaxID=118781 RepID=A0A8X7XSV3_POPTO|nr:hypothetical protein POTOM_057549 [Populus tomentosa]
MSSSSSSSSASIAKLKVAGTWAGLLEVETENWTVPMLREEIAKRSNMGTESINLIFAGKVLKDCTSEEKNSLSQLGIKNNSKILACRVSVEEGKTLKNELLADDERNRRLARIREQILKCYISWEFCVKFGLFRRRVFFNYEKRIRLQSPPEKSIVSVEFAGLMNLFNINHVASHILLQKLVFLLSPFHVQRLVADDQTKKLLTSNLLLDSLISICAYLNVRVSITDKLIEEFKKVMGLMRAQNRQGAGHRDGRRFGLKVAEPVENGGLLEYFFGKDGRTCLQHERFVQFLGDLHDEECHNIDSIADKFPFSVLLCSDESSILDSVHDHCLIVLVYNSQELNLLNFTDFTAGIISAKDFALSLVASAAIRHISKLLDRVDEVSNEPQIRDIRITFEVFKNFAELRRQLQYLSLAIFSYGKVNGVLTKKDFQRASSQVSD